ncbi:hypothetical protein AB0H36_12080 [Kribbella sp. NPDC050820]|uniref:hypothetical protein n=1 Tax=Kribbella sp. NPDC050820 TaxID=3155408 RepID=UPI0033F09CAB
MVTIARQQALDFWGEWHTVIFFVRNFTGAVLELDIGPEQVDVRRDEIRAFSAGVPGHQVRRAPGPGSAP